MTVQEYVIEVTDSTPVLLNTQMEQLMYGSAPYSTRQGSAILVITRGPLYWCGNGDRLQRALDSGDFSKIPECPPAIYTIDVRRNDQHWVLALPGTTVKVGGWQAGL